MHQRDVVTVGDHLMIDAGSCRPSRFHQMSLSVTGTATSLNGLVSISFAAHS